MSAFRHPATNWLYESPCLACGGVDAEDPEPAEDPLLGLAVAIRVDERVLDLLLGLAIAECFWPQYPFA